MFVCVKCERIMKPKKNGYPFIETMAGGKPYKLWMGDLWQCLGCDAEVIVTNNLQHPIAENYQPDFAAKCASYEAKTTAE